MLTKMYVIRATGANIGYIVGFPFRLFSIIHLITQKVNTPKFIFQEVLTFLIVFTKSGKVALFFRNISTKNADFYENI